jgi:hypothetical protein
MLLFVRLVLPMVLAFASTVIFGPESYGTHDFNFVSHDALAAVQVEQS